jgi:hypothetical protein
MLAAKGYQRVARGETFVLETHKKERCMLTRAGLCALLFSGCTVNIDAAGDGDGNGNQNVEAPPAKEEVVEPDRAAKDPDAGAQQDGVDGEQTGDAQAAGAADAGFGGENSLFFVNVSTETICFVHVDTCDGAASSPDLLGRDVLETGWYLRITGLESQCYDFWAFDCGGRYYWAGRFDLMGDFTWLLYGGGGVSLDTGFDTYFDSGI